MHNNQGHVTHRQESGQEAVERNFRVLHCCILTDYGWNDQFCESFSVRLQMFAVSDCL